MWLPTGSDANRPQTPCEKDYLHKLAFNYILEIQKQRNGATQPKPWLQTVQLKIRLAAYEDAVAFECGE